MKPSALSFARVVTAAAAAFFTTAALAAADPANEILMRNARLQTRIYDALANSRMDPLRAAQVQERAAEVFRMQAQTLSSATDEQHEQLRQAQRDLAGAITWAQNHPSKKAKSEPMDRTRLQVATMRTAEQQRLIARAVSSGRFSKEQAASLENAQAQIVTVLSSAAMSDNDISLDEARSIQGQQNLQDYSIKENPGIVDLLAMQAEGEELQPKR
jgi:hypothetical protein